MANKVPSGQKRKPLVINTCVYIFRSQYFFVSSLLLSYILFSVLSLSLCCFYHHSILFTFILCIPLLEIVVWVLLTEDKIHCCLL
jgi:hypothetical protein